MTSGEGVSLLDISFRGCRFLLGGSRVSWGSLFRSGGREGLRYWGWELVLTRCCEVERAGRSGCLLSKGSVWGGWFIVGFDRYL